MNLTNQIESFCKHLNTKGRSSSTITAYKTDLTQFSKFIGEQELKEISTRDINKFQKFLFRENNLTKKSITRKLNSIKSFFKFAIESENLVKNPAEKIAYPQTEDTAPKKLSQIEYKAIRDTARANPKIYTMIELMLQTGMKIGELSRLKLEEVKLDSNPPHIFIGQYQTNPSRIVELNDPARESMRQYIENRPKVRDDQGYLFPTRTGRRTLPRNIRTAMNRVFENAGVKSATVNELRNTFICHQIEHGMSLERLAEIVGHKHTASTELYLATTDREEPGRELDIAEL
ncbi:tyrosine-type recombinase/integrase [Candidatus Dojkabacteria bacterium]|nr:tyrosine-type recombinase/integrase [Candidatus Dojkabacteria bacterium]